MYLQEELAADVREAMQEEYNTCHRAKQKSGDKKARPKIHLLLESG